MRMLDTWAKRFLVLILQVCRKTGQGSSWGDLVSKGEKYQLWLPLECPPLGTWPATQACALTGNQTGDTLVHRLVLNLLSHTSQGYFLYSK